MRTRPMLFLLLGASLFGSCQHGRPVPSAVDETLDAWHRAAAAADQDRYLSVFAPGSVFLGTDASEHWTLEEFEDYVQRYFSVGRGFNYEPFDRRVRFDADGTTAWFDERLKSSKYGELRGTGVLQWMHGRWQLMHYSMTFPIPNDLTKTVVGLIRREAPP